MKQQLLNGQLSEILREVPQVPDRESLVNLVKEKGKPWAIAALIDGSIGYHSVESAEQRIDALLKGEQIGACERTMCCFRGDGIVEIDHDFKYFAGRDEQTPDRIRLIVGYVEEVLKNNKKRGHPRSWIEQTSESMAYPTRRIA